MTESTFELPDDRSLVRAPEMLSADLGSEWAMLDLEAGVYYGMEGVAARVWEMLASPTSVRHLRERLLDTYDVDVEHLDKDLRVFLADLLRRGLIKDFTI